MDFLSNIVQQVITVLYNMTATVGLPNYGLAIIIMTIIVKILLYPLTKKQIESTKAMMAMQPKMKAIQEKYKNDKQRLNMELANLYKQENVNPLAGCLPLLVQMPIMIGILPLGFILGTQGAQHGLSAIGMAIIARAAAKRGICTDDTCAQILALLRQYGLPTETAFTRDALTDAARSDKKIADGKLHLIVPERIGRCRIETIPAADIPAWLADGGIA